MGCLQMLLKNLLSQEVNDCIHEEALSSTWGSCDSQSWVPSSTYPGEGQFIRRVFFLGRVLFHLEWAELIKFFIQVMASWGNTQ